MIPIKSNSSGCHDLKLRIMKRASVALFICITNGGNFSKAEDGISSLLEVDPQSGAASLRIPLGPGVGRSGLRYVPALVGRFAPQVGLTALSQGGQTGSPVAIAPTLLAATGFELAPGTLVLGFDPGKAPGGILEAMWTYPDGAGGRTCGAFAAEATPEALWARFGYGSGQEPVNPPHRSEWAFPAHQALSGLGGDLLVALPDTPPDSDLEETGESVPGSAPRGLLAIRAGIAYEYRFVTGLQEATRTRSAHYRLTAARAPSGEAVTFTYGPNGVDFVAAWGTEKVQVALAGLAATAPTPALGGVPLDPAVLAPASCNAEACLRVTYEGSEAIPGYTLVALTRPEWLTPEGRPMGGLHGTSCGDRMEPDSFRRTLQVSRVQQDLSGEAILFGYGTAAAVCAEGPSGTQSFAPTVLQEISTGQRTIELEWEGLPYRRQTGQPHPEGILPNAWSFGVAALHDRCLAGGTANPTGSDYRLGMARPQGSPWVRQSRHFALGLASPPVPACMTYVRDRWEFGSPRARATAPESMDPQGKAAFDYEGDIPAFELDPGSLTLVPVAGQLTRWLNWKQAAEGLGQPPDLHDASPPRCAGMVGLMGGGKDPEGPPETKTLGPITYAPSKGEVTMEAIAGSAQAGAHSAAPYRLPDGYSGPIPVGLPLPSKWGDQMAQARLQMEESSKAAMAQAAERIRQTEMAIAPVAHAYQAMKDAQERQIQERQQRLDGQKNMQMLAARIALENQQAEQAIQRQLEMEIQQTAQQGQAVREQVADVRQQVSATRRKIELLNQIERDAAGGVTDALGGQGAFHWKLESCAPSPMAIGPLGEAALLELGFIRELGKSVIESLVGSVGDLFAVATGLTITGDPIDRRRAAVSLAVPFVPAAIKKSAKAIIWTAYEGRHLASAKIPWSRIAESTLSGPAKYLPGTTVEILEKMIWEKGAQVHGRTWKIMELPHVIGASEGKPSRWVRVEESAGTIHGHPITEEEFHRLLRK